MALAAPDAAAVDLGRLAERIKPVVLAREQVLPVLAPLEGLLPHGGLRRGTTVSVGGGPGATSLALALLAGSSAAGSWTAMVGLPSVGLVAAGELGVSLGRVALVAAPAGDALGGVVATLVDAFDLVLVGVRLRPGDSRRLAARAKERGAVLVHIGNGGGTAREAGPEVRLTVTDAEWQGVGDGHGHLQARRVVVTAEGRGAAARQRQVELWLPGADGEVAIASPSPVVRQLRGVG